MYKTIPIKNHICINNDLINCAIVLFVTQHLGMIHWLKKKEEKKSSTFCLECLKLHLSIIFSSPTVFNPKKTILTPAGLVIQAKEIFPAIKKEI